MATPLSARLCEFLGSCWHSCNIFPCCYILFCFWSNRSLSPGWYSFEGLEMGFWSWQVCPDRGWYMPIHQACGIGFVETCSPFSMLVCAFCRCWIVARWWKSWNHVPRPQKILRHPKPKTTHCLLFALFWSMFGRARITSTPLTVNLVIISSIRQGSRVLLMVISWPHPIRWRGCTLGSSSWTHPCDWACGASVVMYSDAKCAAFCLVYNKKS